MSDNNKLSILIAENDTRHSLALNESLLRLGHIVAGIAQNPKDAIRMHRILAPDLVLMDLNLPGMDGIQAANEMAKQAGTPVIITSRVPATEAAKRASCAGIYSYLIKPVIDQVLDLSIKNAVKTSQIKAAIKYQLENMQNDLFNLKNLSRAIGYLMDSLSLDEEAAREHLDHQSEQAGITRERMAARISRQLDLKRATAG
jgi:AmiR/NasT family two-component response regulator